LIRCMGTEIHLRYPPDSRQMETLVEPHPPERVKN
jgi:hypothetical protein